MNKEELKHAESGVSGGCMNTISGILLDPVNVTADDICLYDIAHPLSYICRGTGQVKFFFSVAQHCLNCAYEARARGYSDRVVLAALLHDGSEAYMSDVIRPIKVHIDAFYEIESRFVSAIYEHFGLGDLSEDELAKVTEIDDDMLWNEAKALFSRADDIEPPKLSCNVRIEERPFAEIEEEYIALANELAEKLLITD